MRAKLTWKEKMEFVGECSGKTVAMDSKPPLGSGNGMTPKELVALGIAGCTAMDVISLMRKHKQNVESFEVFTEVIQTEGSHPVVFKDVSLVYDFKGQVEVERAKEAVELSQSKYCGVSAMISKVAPIHYKIVVNGSEVAEGQAHFSI